MQLLFWISAALIVYIYIGYPLLLRLLPKRPPAYDANSLDKPKVSVLIAAFNEKDAIAATLQNKLDQTYPGDLLEIIVISDESDDGTDEIVQAMAKSDSRIRLIRQSPRQGKTAGLNLAMPEASGEIIVFSDANSHYAPDVIEQLVACFSDPDVGYVTGKMCYVDKLGSMTGDGCSAYMKYENAIRRLETKISSVVGVDGGIDAMRKVLYQTMNPDQLPDFVQPLKVVAQGKRVVYCEDAILQEEALTSPDTEFRMRVRVSLRAYWAMWDMRVLFNPLGYGLFTLQLVSHKLLRYLAFFPLILVLIISAILSDHHWFYALAFITQIIFYSVAAYVSMSGSDNSTNKWFALANYFCLINIASLLAFIKFVQRKKIVLWKPRSG